MANSTNADAAPQTASPDGTGERRRMPLIQLGILLIPFTLLVQVLLGLSGLPDPARLAVYMGGVFAGLILIIVGCLDKWAVRPHLKAYRIPGFWLYLFGLVALVLLVPAVLAASAAARRAAESGQVIPVEGLPFAATLPVGWHEMPAPPGSDYGLGNHDESVAIWFSATRVEDVPAEYRTPEGALKVWHSRLPGFVKDFTVSASTSATLMGATGLESRVEATTPVPGAGGTQAEEARVLFVRRVAVKGAYVVETTLCGPPSVVRQIPRGEIDQLLEVVQPTPGGGV